MHRRFRGNTLVGLWRCRRGLPKLLCVAWGIVGEFRREVCGVVAAVEDENDLLRRSDGNGNDKPVLGWEERGRAGESK